MTNPNNKLWNRNFFLVWQGQFASLLGNQAFMIAMMFWVKQTTESATTLGLIMMSANIPAVLLSVVGGSIADRYNRKKIIIAIDAINGIAVCSLALIMFQFPDHTNLILGYLFFVAMLLGTTGGFFRPAILAALPDIVPQDKLASANSVISATVQFAQLAGNSVGGILFRVLGAPLLFLVDGITYLFSAFSESFIDLPDNSKQEKKAESIKEVYRHFIDDTKEGFAYLMKRTGMKEFFVVASIINFSVIPGIVLLPFYVEDHLGQVSDWYGFIIASYGVGSMFGFLGASLIKAKGNKKLATLSISYLGLCGCIITMGLIDYHIYALLLMSLAGAFNGYLNVNMLTIIQSNIDDDMRGRA